MALGCVVELGETGAVGCELVEVGSLDFTSVAAEIGEAHVVNENDDDVGAFVGRQFARENETENESEVSMHGTAFLVGNRMIQ